MSENNRLDRRDKAILQYIKEHDGTNENEIVKELLEQKLSSKLTTLKKLKDLKQRGEITDSLKEGQSGFHHYSINKDKSEFNQVYERLLRIEVLLDRGKKFADITSTVDEYFYTSTQTYFLSLNFMLVRLLQIIKDKIRSERDSQILFRRNIDLLAKLFVLNPPKNFFKIFRDNMISDLQKMRSRVEQLRLQVRTTPKKTNVDASKYKDEFESIKHQLDDKEKSIKLLEDIMEELNSNVYA